MDLSYCPNVGCQVHGRGQDQAALSEQPTACCRQTSYAFREMRLPDYHDTSTEAHDLMVQFLGCLSLGFEETLGASLSHLDFNWCLCLYCEKIGYMCFQWPHKTT